MANPINPATGRPWTDQEMAYFRLIEQNSGDPTFGANADRYLTYVANPNAETGNPRYIQGLDPYQQRGGLDWANWGLNADVARQAAEMARQGLDFSKGQAVGWVDGRRTLEGVMRDDDIRRNPMNAAIYEQERRGYRADAGNMNPEQYMYGNVGDEAKGAPKAAPKTGAGKGATPGTPLPTPPKLKTAPRATGSVGEAFYNAATGQYEFAPTGGGSRFSVDKKTGSRLAAGDTGAGTRGTGDDRIGVGGTDYDKGSMSRAVQDLTKRIGSMTPEAAKAFADYDRSRGVPGAMHGGMMDEDEQEEVPGYDGENYGFGAGPEGSARAMEFARLMNPEFEKYAQGQAAKLGTSGVPREGSESANLLRNKFSEGLRRIALLRDDIDAIQRLQKSGGDVYTPEARARMGRIQQMLNIDWKADKDRILTDEPNPDLGAAADASQRSAANFFLKEIMRMQPYGQGFTDTLNAYKQYAPWLRELEDPQISSLSTPSFAGGGGMRLGGAPHWITDRFLKPVAAITEDGKDEVVKGKGGLEVVPTDAGRKKNYLARKKGEKNATSRNTANLGDGSSARRKSAAPGDGRANNGKTNNGRPSFPGDRRDNKQAGVGGRDAMTVRPSINGGMPGNPTLPMPTPNGLIPYRSIAPGRMMPLFPPIPGGATGMRLTGDIGGGQRGRAGAELMRSGQLGSGKFFRSGGSGLNFRGLRDRIGSMQPRVSAPGAPSGQVAQPNVSAPGAPSGSVMPAMDASGGNRVIGNATAPTARYGFDKAAPIDIAAHGATRGVKGLPGVSVAQPWKHAPRALLQRGTFGNQLLQSYWNATGGASTDLAERGAAAAPRSAMSGRSFY